jgi:hypothetical protein
MAGGNAKANGQGAFKEGPMTELEERQLETRLRARKEARAEKKSKISVGEQIDELFKEAELDRRGLVSAFGLGVCPVNLPEGATFTLDGLATPPKYVSGHFVTKELGLDGVLLATHSGDAETLRSPLWELVAQGCGGVNKVRREFVLFNIISFEAGYDQGSNLKKLLPKWAWDLAESLLVEALNYCGPPDRAASFGAPVRVRSRPLLLPHSCTPRVPRRSDRRSLVPSFARAQARKWFSPRNRARLGLWPEWTGEMHSDSPHISLLYNRFFNRGHVNEKWIDDFGSMCLHMGGDARFTDDLKGRIRRGFQVWGKEASEVYRLWRNKRISQGLRASWVNPNTHYGSAEWREAQSKNVSKSRKELFADPQRGPLARENLSKGRKELFADPQRGPLARENHSKGSSKLGSSRYGSRKNAAAPPDESEDAKRARLEAMLESAKQRARRAQPCPGSENWPEADDRMVIEHVIKHGNRRWQALEEHFEGRHSRQACLQRWDYTLDPDRPLQKRRRELQKRKRETKTKA